MFTPVTVPYLRSEYGKEFEFDAPVKILDKLLHDMCVSLLLIVFAHPHQSLPRRVALELHTLQTASLSPCIAAHKMRAEGTLQRCWVVLSS